MGVGCNRRRRERSRNHTAKMKSTSSKVESRHDPLFFFPQCEAGGERGCGCKGCPRTAPGVNLSQMSTSRVHVDRRGRLGRGAQADQPLLAGLATSNSSSYRRALTKSCLYLRVDTLARSSLQGVGTEESKRQPEGALQHPSPTDSTPGPHLQWNAAGAGGWAAGTGH